MCFYTLSASLHLKEASYHVPMVILRVVLLADHDSGSTSLRPFPNLDSVEASRCSHFLNENVPIASIQADSCSM
jgi:hypothetical protein